MNNRQIYFDKPGTCFPEALPLGNGRLGAMVFGGVEEETIILNESSMWSGSVEKSDREDAHTYLPQIRELLSCGKVKEAEKIFSEHFTCEGKGSGMGNGARVPFGCYQVLGKLKLSFFQHTPFAGVNSLEVIDSYSRVLDVEKALAKVQFESQQNIFMREILVSAPDEAIVLHFTANKENQISFIAALDRTECSETTNESDDTILMRGILTDGKEGDGIHYACLAKAVCKGGRVYTRQGRLYVERAQEVTLFITAETTLKGIVGRKNKDALAAAKADISAASKKTWQEIKNDHENYFCPLFSRTDLILSNDNKNKETLPEMRQIAVLNGGDTKFDELYAAFAKYLFISASRKGEIAANLQGLWAEDLHTPWNGDWHFNAQQMIYWPAEVWNLSQLHEPYLRLIEALQEPGKKTAKAYYNAQGWVVHTFTNPWGFTSPGEDAAWGSTTGSAAWLCEHIWEHYLYTRDTEYLKEFYPVIRGAVLFYKDMLVLEKKDGYLVTSPSDSPENRYFTAQGDNCALCMGPTYDNQLIRYLFTAFTSASKLLSIHDELTEEIAQMKEHLVPTRVGSDGRIMEWLEEFDEPLPYHRHVSHLWGVYPGDEITTEKTPELVKATLLSLKARKDLSAEWAIAHRACIYARLHKAKEAYSNAQKMLLNSTFPNLFAKCHHTPENIQPTIMPSHEDYHFPFQFDGNMGILTYFAEALLQSFAQYENGEIFWKMELLPCLPEKWAKGGSVRGLVAKGGFTVDIKWENSEVTKAVIRGNAKVSVKINEKIKTVFPQPGEEITL